MAWDCPCCYGETDHYDEKHRVCVSGCMWRGEFHEEYWTTECWWNDDDGSLKGSKGSDARQNCVLHHPAASPEDWLDTLGSPPEPTRDTCPIHGPTDETHMGAPWCRKCGVGVEFVKVPV